MTRTWQWLLMFGLAMLLVGPLGMAAAQAKPAATVDDDEDDGPAGELNPKAMWSIVTASWDRREYKDAAVLAERIADQNPFEDFSLEAYWRAFICWRELRQDEKRRVICHDKGMELCTKWEKKYSTDKNKAALAMWYRAMYLERDGQRSLAINVLEDAEKRYPGSSKEWDITWHLGEWLRDAKRFSEAIPYYDTFWTLNGTNQWGAHALNRIGMCYQEQKNYTDAIAIWTKLLTSDGFNWGWGEVHWNALDIGRRLKNSMNEGELARRFFLRIIDKCNADWDVTKQAKAEVGETPKPHIWVMPHQNFRYTTDRKSINENSKIKLSKEVAVLFRPAYVTKETPFKGTLSITAKQSVKKGPENMTVAEKDEKKTYTVDVQTPNEKGQLMGDTWYRFVMDDAMTAPPDRLRITREWEKAGKTWGECTITVQSSTRWHIWVWLPTNTNADNFQINKPNEVHENGRLFRWYDWWALEQGVVFKFKVPIEVGAGVAEYYPRMRLEHGGWGWGYQDKHVTAKENSTETKELSFKLTSDTEYPTSFQYPGGVEVVLEEVKN
jgi:tetratricopeptide (TPR) repeat protein